MEAALKGSQQIAFTIISLTFSLIAVLIPLLFMGEVVGRLFREFAITLAVVDPHLGRGVAHAHADDGGAAAQAHAAREAGQVLPQDRRDVRPRDRTATTRRSTWVLDHQPLTMIVFLVTLVLTVILYILIPKGFFPLQDTGLIQGISEAPQTASFTVDVGAQPRRSPRSSSKDPAVRERVVLHRRGRHQHHAELRAPAHRAEAPRRRAPSVRDGDGAPASSASPPRKASRSTCSRCRTSRSRTA